MRHPDRSSYFSWAGCGSRGEVIPASGREACRAAAGMDLWWSSHVFDMGAPKRIIKRRVPTQACSALDKPRERSISRLWLSILSSIGRSSIRVAVRHDLAPCASRIRLRTGRVRGFSRELRIASEPALSTQHHQRAAAIWMRDRVQARCRARVNPVIRQRFAVEFDRRTVGIAVRIPGGFMFYASDDRFHGNGRPPVSPRPGHRAPVEARCRAPCGQEAGSPGEPATRLKFQR